MTNLMLTPREKVLMLGKSLPIGTTDNRELCFYCDGGESKDRSFSVTRQDKLTVAYICHRAKCGKRGFVYLDGGSGEETTKVGIFNPNPYRGQTIALEYEDLSWLDNKYGLDLEYVVKAGWVRAIEPGFALAMPVLSPVGGLRGVVIRRVLETGRKYVNSYKIADEPWICWYRTAIRDVVVVEDQISALKAARFATSVALLGTALSYDKLDEIKQVAGPGKIWLALDKDASTNTLDYLRRYRTYCGGNLNGLMLSKDIKDMSYSEIAKLGEPFSREV